MLYEISSVLNHATVERIRRMLDRAPFVDGRASAGPRAARVKANEEVASDTPMLAELNDAVLGALWRHPVFRSVVLPHRMARAFFARYAEGMKYGNHVDDPVMGYGERYRCDVAVTTFLSAPTEYDGGELVVRTTFGERHVKRGAGDAVVYPASSLHRVTEVTRGVRLVAVTWAQSLIRDPARREIVHELDVARQALAAVTPDADVTARIDGVYANLVRMWSSVWVEIGNMRFSRIARDVGAVHRHAATATPRTDTSPAGNRNRRWSCGEIFTNRPVFRRPSLADASLCALGASRVAVASMPALPRTVRDRFRMRVRTDRDEPVH